MAAAVAAAEAAAVLYLTHGGNFTRYGGVGGESERPIDIA